MATAPAHLYDGHTLRWEVKKMSVHPALASLLGIGSEAIGPALSAGEAARSLRDWSRPGADLALMLDRRNGFYAFESALLVRPVRHSRPFICGGEYRVENLYSLSDVEGMGFRASIANQIRDLPDGSRIVFKVVR